MNFKATVHLAWLVASGLVLLPGSVEAADVFVLDPARSSVALSGTLAGFDAKEQGPGSLQSRLSGTLLVELAGDTIHFPGASLMAAEETGEWEPAPGGVAGRAPAAFGARADLGFLGSGLAAARNVTLDAETLLPLSLVNGEFNAGQVLFLFPEGGDATLDYLVTGLFGTSGSELLAGYATNAVAGMGSLVVEGDVATLTIPIYAEFLLELLSPDDSSLVVEGQLVATRQSVVPGPTLAPPVIADGNISFSWSGGGELEVSTDFMDWTPTGNQSGSFSEPVSSTGTKFYRIGPG